MSSRFHCLDRTSSPCTGELTFSTPFARLPRLVVHPKALVSSINGSSLFPSGLVMKTPRSWSVVIGLAGSLVVSSSCAVRTLGAPVTEVNRALNAWLPPGGITKGRAGISRRTNWVALRPLRVASDTLRSLVPVFVIVAAASSTTLWVVTPEFSRCMTSQSSANPGRG